MIVSRPQCAAQSSLIHYACNAIWSAMSAVNYCICAGDTYVCTILSNETTCMSLTNKKFDFMNYWNTYRYNLNTQLA